MPATNAHDVKVQELRKDDKVKWWTEDDIVSGKTKIKGNALVQKVERKTKNVALTLQTHDGIVEILVRVDAEFHIERTEATEEEKEADRNEWLEKRARQQMEAAIGEPDRMIAEQAAKMVGEKATWLSGRDYIEFGYALAKAYETEKIWLIVLKVTLGWEATEGREGRDPMPLLQAVEEMREELKAELVRSISHGLISRSTSASSNMDEDAHRVAKAEFVENRWF